MFLFQTVGRVIVTWYSAIKCILFSWGCVVKFQAREANSWRRSASSNPGNWVCVLFLFLSFFLSLSLFPSLPLPLSFFFSCSLSFLFIFSHLLLAFFHDQTHTHKQGSRLSKRSFVRFNVARDEKLAMDLVRSTLASLTREVRRDAERPKVDRYMAVCFTRFVDYRLMFDSGRSFSLEYDLIRLPYWGAHNPPAVLKIPRILASPTSRSACVLYLLALR